MAALTSDYLRLKQTFYPHALSQVPHLLGYILVEIKNVGVRRVPHGPTRPAKLLR